jgi:nitrate reductase NapE component
MKLIDLILMAGGLLAALAVSAVCGLGLVVWLAGGRNQPPK